MSLYHVFTVENSAVLRIDHIGFSKSPKVNRFGPGQRDLWLIHYVTHGKGYFNGNPVHAGQGFLIRRGQKEQYFPDKEDPWTFLWITSSDDTMGAFFEKYPVDKKTQIFDYQHVSSVENVMNYIKLHHNKILSCEQLFEIFLHIFNKHFEAGVCASTADEYFNFATQYMNTHIHTKIRIGELAGMIGITPTYLFDLFKERLNISPKQYLNRQRAYMAKRMLKSTDFTITEIAHSVGYDDVLAFSRFFRNQVGYSPTTYKVNDIKAKDTEQ